MYGRLRDWRRVAMRAERCPKVFPSAVTLVATVIDWLGGLSVDHAVAYHLGLQR